MDKIMLSANQQMLCILQDIITKGHKVVTRNAPAYRLMDYPHILFDQTPLFTIRKTAWKKALREMEWFMSGEPKCPPELMDWWAGQLNENDEYLGGYGEQMRHQGNSSSEFTINTGFDQVHAILKSLQDHPFGRRHIMTTWEPFTMNHITDINGNLHTPTTCHGSLTQFFVQDQCLHLKTYQRSADILLGVPHNWMQYWAFLHYFAYHTNLYVGTLIWIFGDLHLYDEPSHIDCARSILNQAGYAHPTNFELEYHPSGIMKNGCPEFLAEDFTINGEIPAPTVFTRPKLLA